MTRAATGEANLLGLSGHSTTSYLCELAVIAMGYFALAEAVQLLPALNAAAMPLRPPTGLALGLFLLRGNRVWPAILIGSFCANASSLGLTTLSASPATVLATTTAALSGAWLINHWVHGRDKFTSPSNIAKCVLIAFAPTAIISSGLAAAGTVVAHLARLRRTSGGFDRHRGKVVARGRNGDCDYRSCHFALGD